MTTTKHVCGTIKARADLIRDALRFAYLAAGEGIEIDGHAPEDFLMAYSEATGDEDWETFADRLAAIQPDPEPQPCVTESAKTDTQAALPDTGDPQEPQPVAWVCWDLAFGCGAKHFTSDRHIVDARLKQPNSWRVEPLYATPSSAGMVSVEAALNKIRELNMTATDENGHRWANSDLIDQEVTFGLIALRALAGERG